MFQHAQQQADMEREHQRDEWGEDDGEEARKGGKDRDVVFIRHCEEGEEGEDEDCYECYEDDESNLSLGHLQRVGFRHCDYDRDRDCD